MHALRHVVHLCLHLRPKCVKSQPMQLNTHISIAGCASRQDVSSGATSLIRLPYKGMPSLLYTCPLGLPFLLRSGSHVAALYRWGMSLILLTDIRTYGYHGDWCKCGTVLPMGIWMSIMWFPGVWTCGEGEVKHSRHLQ